MFGFGGGFNGPGGGSTNSGSAPSGRSMAGPNKGGDGMSPSERNAQGKEGSNSGPGNPGHTSSTAGHEGSTSGPGNPGHSTSSANGNAGREGQRAGPGNPDAGHSVDPARFGGGSPGGGIDPARFGGTPMGMSPTDVTRGFGAAMGATTGEIDRAAQARADERRSMDTYDAAARTRADNAKRADMAQAVRADENTSMGRYSAAAALSEANALRADTASSIRTAENTSMKDLDSLKASYRDAIAGIESVGIADPYSALGGYIKSKNDRAYGKYQMMGANIPSWTKQALGYSMTPKEFLADPKAQDATFDHIFGGYVAKYGLEKAAQAWYGGEDSIGKLGRTDPHGKINVGQYGAKVARDQAASYDARKRGLDSSTDVANKPVAESFASTYLGRSQPGPEFGRVGTITGVSPEVAYFGGAPTGISDEESAKNVQLQEQRQREAAAAPEDATPKNASIAGGDKPKAAEGDFPDRPRSNFEKFAAAGLDIGAGLIPGVGLGVGLVNGALSLTGNRTIGERLVDAIATGGGKYTPGAPGDPNRPTVVADATTIPQKTVPTVESFADSYLNPPDTTKYPTPYQRYDVNRNTYAGV